MLKCTMRLSTLIKDLGIISLQGTDPEIKGISSNSEQIREGYLFVAIKGQRNDGHRFIEETIKRGAVAVVLEDDILPRVNFPLIKVKNPRLVLARIADRFFNHPSAKIQLIGITGTNGKTTVSYLIKNILENFNKKIGLLGTINYEIGDRIIPASNTTPDTTILNSYLQDMIKENIDYAILEVSSHSISQHRIKYLDFNSGVFTNFSNDHLDYHKNRENYFRVKKSFFESLSSESKAIVNIDDYQYRNIVRDIRAKVFTYGMREEADVFLKKDSLSFSLAESKFTVCALGQEFEIECPLIGEYNVYNILAAVCLCLTQGVPKEIIKKSLKNFAGLPGRLERIDCGQNFILFIDYAHTEEALRNVLVNLRKFVHNGRLISIFGCGGDRDKEKRPSMGKIGSRLSDFVILTSDNPRSEEPQEIILDIQKGIEGDNYEIILDRGEAIRKGLSLAKQNDIVLIAGKGHEKYQVLKDTIIPFSDAEVAKRCLSKKF